MPLPKPVSIAAGHDIWCELVIYPVQSPFLKLDEEKIANLDRSKEQGLLNTR